MIIKFPYLDVLILLLLFFWVRINFNVFGLKRRVKALKVESSLKFSRNLSVASYHAIYRQKYGCEYGIEKVL